MMPVSVDGFLVITGTSAGPVACADITCGREPEPPYQAHFAPPEPDPATRICWGLIGCLAWMTNISRDPGCGRRRGSAARHWPRRLEPRPTGAPEERAKRLRSACWSWPSMPGTTTDGDPIAAADRRASTGPRRSGSAGGTGSWAARQPGRASRPGGRYGTSCAHLRSRSGPGITRAQASVRCRDGRGSVVRACGEGRRR
jgi:hypothetical protein